MAHVYLVRHAACDALGRRLAGRAPGERLNAAGEAQARALADRLAPVAFRAVASGPLERVRQTAEAIARGRGLDVRVLPGVDEIDFGAWTGRTFAELDADPAWRRFNAARGVARPPGGETTAEVQARAGRAVEALLEEHPDGPVAVVSHADVIKAVVALHLGLPAESWTRLEVAPASTTVLDVSPWGARLLKLNEE